MNIDLTQALESNPVLKAQLGKLAKIKGFNDIGSLISFIFSGEGRSTLAGLTA